MRKIPFYIHLWHMTQYVRNGFSKTCSTFVSHYFTQMAAATFIQNYVNFNPLNAVLNPICHLFALLGAHPILHVGRIRVKETLQTISVSQAPNIYWTGNLHV